MYLGKRTVKFSVGLSFFLSYIYYQNTKTILPVVSLPVNFFKLSYFFLESPENQEVISVILNFSAECAEPEIVRQQKIPACSIGKLLSPSFFDEINYIKSQDLLEQCIKKRCKSFARPKEQAGGTKFLEIVTKSTNTEYMKKAKIS